MAKGFKQASGSLDKDIIKPTDDAIIEKKEEVHTTSSAPSGGLKFGKGFNVSTGIDAKPKENIHVENVDIESKPTENIEYANPKIKETVHVEATRKKDERKYEPPKYAPPEVVPPIPKKKSYKGLVAGIAAAVICISGVSIAFLISKGGNDTPVASSSSYSSTSSTASTSSSGTNTSSVSAPDTSNGANNAVNQDTAKSPEVVEEDKTTMPKSNDTGADALFSDAVPCSFNTYYFGKREIRCDVPAEFVLTDEKDFYGGILQDMESGIDMSYMKDSCSIFTLPNSNNTYMIYSEFDKKEYIEALRNGVMGSVSQYMGIDIPENNELEINADDSIGNMYLKNIEYSLDIMEQHIQSMGGEVNIIESPNNIKIEYSIPSDEGAVKLFMDWKYYVDDDEVAQTSTLYVNGIPTVYISSRIVDCGDYFKCLTGCTESSEYNSQINYVMREFN